MVLDLVDGVLPIVLVDAKGPCQPASSLPSNTTQAILHVRDGGQGPNYSLVSDFVSFCKSFVCKLPAENDAKHHVPDQLPRLVTEPG